MIFPKETLGIWQGLAKKPGGKWLFSQMLAVLSLYRGASQGVASGVL